MNVAFRALRLSDDPGRGAGRDFAIWRPGMDTSRCGEVSVVLASAGEEVAASLLRAGVGQVLIGEAALRDSQLIERLVKGYGSKRIGLYVPVRRPGVNWSFGDRSNEDFRVVTPSRAEPAWEVLFANQQSSGALAIWWIDEMLRRGAHTVLLRADIHGDVELNLCAGMVEACGERLWLAPLTQPSPDLNAWVAFGQARQFALPVPVLARIGELYSPQTVAALRAEAGQGVA